MKHYYIVLLLLWSALGFGQITTVSYDFSAIGAVNGLNEEAPGILLDANIGFGSFTNGGTAYPKIYSDQLRLYQHATKGGSIVIYANNGVTITDVVIHASDETGDAGYTVDGGAQVNLSGGNTYTISGINATSQVEFFQRGSNRIYVDSFDVTYIPSGGSLPTQVQFTSASASVSEDAGSYDLEFSITNEDASNATSFDVVLTSGDATAIDNYSTQTVTFAAGSSANQTLSLTITDNAIYEGDKTLHFEIQNVSGGNNAIAGNPDSFELTIDDDEAAPVPSIDDIIITEIMYNTTSYDDEWIEIYNTTSSDIILDSNWTLEYQSSSYTFENTVIAAHSYLTIGLGSNGDGTFNNDNPFTPDISTIGSPIASINNTNNLVNSSATISIIYSSEYDTITIDTVTYDDGSPWPTNPDGDGPSLELYDINLDNSLASSWVAESYYGGTPGRGYIETYTYNGSWSPSDPNTDVTVNDALVIASGNASITADVHCNSVSVEAGASLTVDSSASLTADNGITAASGASILGSGSINSDITYNRELPTANWYLVSAPVVGQDIDAFVSATPLATGSGSNLGLAPYNNNGTVWDYYQAGSTNSGDFTSAKGYSIALSNAGNISFTGSMPSTDVDIAISEGSANGFNLIGNPFPSYIPANANADANNNILTSNSSLLAEETLWFWDEGSSQYQTVNQATGSRFIAPTQGFFVKANSTGGDFSFTQAMTSHQSSDSFQRAAQEQRPELQLVLHNGTAVRTTDIFYIDGTTTGFDNGYDSSIFEGTANSFVLYTRDVANEDSRRLSIQSLPNVNYEQMVIPVGVNAEAGSNLTFSANINNFPQGLGAYFEDVETGSITALHNGEQYQISLDEALNGVGRFYIYTTNEALGLSQNSDALQLSIYTIDGGNALRIVGDLQGRSTLKLYDMSGKQLLNNSFEASRYNTFALPRLASGVYLIHLHTSNGVVNTKISIE